MLSKLLKYEVKATARLFIPLYFAVLIMGIINRLINPFEVLEKSKSFNLQAVVSLMSIFLYFALIVTVVVMTFIMVIQRFYKNLISDEGYLMFTLPVKTTHLVTSKLLVAMMWILISICTVVASILIVAKVDNLFGEIAKLYNSIYVNMGFTGIILVIICPLIAISYSINMIYDAIALGHLFTKQKILASFGAYLVLYIIGQIVGAISFVTLAVTNKALFENNVNLSPSQINSFIIFIMAVYGLLSLANYIITNVVLKKKLNLE